MMMWEELREDLRQSKELVWQNAGTTDRYASHIKYFGASFHNSISPLLVCGADVNGVSLIHRLILIVWNAPINCQNMPKQNCSDQVKSAFADDAVK